MFNPVAPYRYLLPTMCLFMADIANPDLFVCVVVGPGFISTSPAFTRSRASHPAGQHGRLAQKNSKSGSHCWGREVFDTICTAVCNRRDSSAACRLCCLEPNIYIWFNFLFFKFDYHEEYWSRVHMTGGPSVCIHCIYIRA